MRFLNDVGGGTIARIIDARTVVVVDDDGFEIPVPVSEIVVAGQENYREKHNQPVVANTPVAKKTEQYAAPPPSDNIEGDNYELLLAFVPVTNSAQTDFDMYFINDSPYYCLYTIACRAEGTTFRLLDRHDLEPEMKKPVARLSQAELNIELSVACLLYKHINYRQYAPEQISLALNPVKFMRSSSFTENDFFDENAYLIKVASSKILPDLQMNIDPKELEKAMKQKKDVKPNLPLPAPNAETEEIDLHIEQLTDNIQGLDNGQMLEMQLARFTIAIELGIASNTHKMVFIHGVGNGKLKHEIRCLLDTKYNRQVRYQDASFREYGYGATLVTLR